MRIDQRIINAVRKNRQSDGSYDRATAMREIKTHFSSDHPELEEGLERLFNSAMIQVDVEHIAERLWAILKDHSDPIAVLHKLFRDDDEGIVGGYYEDQVLDAVDHYIRGLTMEDSAK